MIFFISSRAGRSSFVGRKLSFIPDFARFSKQRREYCVPKSACKSPGLPRKAGKSSSDLPHAPFGADFSNEKSGFITNLMS